MRTVALTRSSVAVVAIIAVLLGVSTLHADEPRTAEPQTSTIRIRLKGPTLRVRCRGGDCAITIVGDGTSFAVSITRTRDGVPFTFARTVENPTNIAVETGLGNDGISLVDVAIPGFLRIGSAAGDDSLELSNTSAAEKVSIDTGRGNDVVHLAPGTFGSKFRINTRSGDDDVSVMGGRFEGKAGFDGGPGTDTLVMLNPLFSQPAVILGFER